MSDEISKSGPPPDVDEVVKLHFRIPSRMPTVYATHSFVQETADEVIVSFFEVVHPIINPAEKEEGAKLLRETGVVAECVARITIAKHKFPEMAQGFAETAKRILDRFGEIVNADDKSNNPEDS